jgi:hypothetical protein
MKTNVVLLGVVLAFIAGCATSQPLPPGLRTESESVRGLRVLYVDVFRDDAGLRVYGQVKKESGYDMSPAWHLDLEVRDGSGAMLETRSFKFSPNPIPYTRQREGKADYSVRLATMPPPDSVIRVTVVHSGIPEGKAAKVAK